MNHTAEPSAGPRRFPRWLPWALLVASLTAHVLVTLAGADPFKMIDLRVYLDGAQWALDGTLYDSTSNSTSAAGTPILLPFTYPPFAALVFVPLSWLNYTVARVSWQVCSVAALAAVIYLALRLLGRAGRGAPRRLPGGGLEAVVVAGTALAVWLEPVRTTLNYGQINLFLAVLLLGGAVVLNPHGADRPDVTAAAADRPDSTVAASPWWRSALAGISVGVGAGIKLVPAVTGLYYLAYRRWWAAVWCVIGFVGTVAAAALVLPQETRSYFTELIFDPARTGPVFGAINQSWRGALARLAGVPDVPGVWAVAVVVSVVVALWALWRTTLRSDLLASFLVVQFLGLLVSPISWSHHWVWVVPLLVWCLFGPGRRAVQVRVLALAWALACFSYLVSVLVAQPDNYEVAARPLWASLAGTVYVVLGMLTLLVLGVTRSDLAAVGSSATRESGAPG